MGYLFAKLKFQQINHHRHYSCYLFVITAFLLLGFTNATNNTTSNVHEGLFENIKKYANYVLGMPQEITDDNLTTTALNETANDTQIHRPIPISSFRIFIMRILEACAILFMIFGGVIPYIPQYLVIKRTKNAEGFSNYVCLTLLVANIIRIEFWFGKRFETPLLIQSIVMIICMLIMLELWTRVHSQAMRGDSSSDTSSQISNSKEQLTEEVSDRRFMDFEVTYFWRWTTFSSYLQFLFIFTVILSIITWLFRYNLVYIETIGLLAVFCEALLGVPQFLRNFRLKSTEGMSVKMVILWTSGDIFKTIYFIVRNAPKQFWLCGILQISIDIAIIGQVIFYSKRCRCCKQ
ncbi:unnamed protein product [Rotaria socialis]|uniref:Solute carrier family 66 member 2 n=1 Tax=Rotaria socialis TaxID=392032 RepID=A0A817LRA9_9BILA|nr:unnamed protein product [Rotaria socialis]CAF3344471.1 unnamed protein product [Rotaria socialis]CAF3363792.1 unnamed protein product [Rotaria socialis]CAF3675127.1 unnamed protein product [Rotaria socialis]